MAQGERFSVSYHHLRQLIGCVGFLMPVGVRLGGLVFEGIWTTDTISAYYYTGMRDVFVATLVLVGVLLACYRTEARQDTVVATLSGCAAVGIGLFPMDPVFADEIVARYPALRSDVCYFNTGILGFHFVFVMLFFASAFYLVAFRFRALTPANPTPEKRKRNKAYALCGGLMLVSFALIGAFALLKKSALVFWPESLAVMAFAAAWLVKGQRFLGDRPERVAGA